MEIQQECQIKLDTITVFYCWKEWGKKGCEKLYAGIDQLTFLRVLKEIGRWHIKAYFF